MTFCERCPENLSTLNNQRLINYEIDPREFGSMSPQKRIQTLIEAMGINSSSSKRMEPGGNKQWDFEKGLIIIKPELFYHYKNVENHIGQIKGLEILSRKDFVYEPWQYWKLYGNDFLQNMDIFPHGALLLLNSTVLRSKLVVFKHPPVSSYIDHFKLLNPQDDIPSWVTTTDDGQKVFNDIVVKYPNQSLRQTVVPPIISNMSIDTMNSHSCPSVCWNYENVYSERTIEQNLKTFNGVHSPRDRCELIMNVQVLSPHL